jgi:hypothetical protein
MNFQTVHLDYNIEIHSKDCTGQIHLKENNWTGDFVFSTSELRPNEHSGRSVTAWICPTEVLEHTARFKILLQMQQVKGLEYQGPGFTV